MPGNKSRAYVFTVPVYTPGEETPDMDELEEAARSFRLAEPTAELEIQFGRGQVNEGLLPHSLEFVGYVEAKKQIYETRLVKWLPDATFEAAPISERDTSLKQVTNVSKRFALSLDPPGSSASSVSLEAYSSGAMSHEGFVLWNYGQPERVKPGGKSVSVADGKGGKSDAIVELLRRHGEESGNPRAGVEAVAKEFPQVFLYAHAGIEKLAQIMVPRLRNLDFVPRPWQEALVDVLRGDPDPRHILWICDPVGGSGKSVLTKYLRCEMNAKFLSPANKADLAFTYNFEPIVIFDLARMTNLNDEVSKACFTISEDFKNGACFSSKYTSCTKQFRVPHVVFFSNSEPPSNVWSADRIGSTVFELSAPATFSATSALERVAGQSDEVLDAAVEKMRGLAAEYHQRRTQRLQQEEPRAPSSSPSLKRARDTASTTF